MVGILREVSQELNVSIDCSDGSSIEFSSPDELFEFVNSDARYIKSLRLSTQWDKDLHIYIRFSSKKYSTPIEYEITGNEKSVSYYSGKLDECISTFRLWYTPLAFFDFTDMLMKVFLCVLLIVLFSLSIWWVFHFEDPKLSQPVTEKLTVRDYFYQITGIVVIWIFLIIGIGVNFFRDRLFPFANFLIGDGVRRFNRLEFWRRTIGISFFISLFASILAGLILR
ncbi:hypothetical protein [Thermodesulfovibrio yellowstonii]|uniref:hypothetical protein n=1 Tax=Thermodesulfovibrio yellowstonii TaxID=28262 RepID=UPI0024937AD5|nr:hypothetical protein [Thermodesulfovibrio islandicus]